MFTFPFCKNKISGKYWKFWRRSLIKLYCPKGISILIYRVFASISEYIEIYPYHKARNCSKKLSKLHIFANNSAYSASENSSLRCLHFSVFPGRTFWFFKVTFRDTRQIIILMKYWNGGILESSLMFGKYWDSRLIA